MRGLLLFTVETAEDRFDREIIERLTREQENRKTLYHLERVSIVIGSRENAFSANGREILWRVPTDEMGDLSDARAASATAQQLVTQLYARVRECQDTACDMVFLSADSPSGTAAIQLSRIVHDRFVTLFPIKTHLMLLQDQLSPFGDARVWHMLQAIRACNEDPSQFYASMYMLPWETSKRESTCATIDALVKVMVIGQENPMLVHRVGTNSMWIGTAAVTHLEAPVMEITRVVFQYLTDQFMQTVLIPATQRSEGVLEGTKGFDDRARALRDMINEIVRSHALMPLTELFEIMPEHDPSPLLSEKEDAPRPDTAWREIYKMYGDDIANSLKARLNPNLEQLEAQYADLGEAVTSGLLKQSLQLAAQREVGFDMLPAIMDTLGQRLMGIADKRNAGDDTELEYRRGLLLSRDVKSAVAVARTRQLYLKSVYDDVRKTFSHRHKEVRERTVERAISESKHYIYTCMVALGTGFRQRCDIHLEQMPSNSHYAVRLREVYTEWCRRNADRLGLITSRDLYDLFTDEVLAMKPEEAAQAICDTLLNTFIKRTEAAVDLIRIHISQFFKEIAFRSSQLPNIGVSEDLIAKLIDYMGDQTTVVPLLFESVGELAIQSPKARAFIFHETGGDSSQEFGLLARERGINVINDPFETGVEMIVKYAGNVLDHALVYTNNKPETGRL